MSNATDWQDSTQRREELSEAKPQLKVVFRRKAAKSAKDRKEEGVFTRIRGCFQAPLRLSK
ncbi:MAG: hypothetical protein WD069_10595, partial [Planctomycetales bacterium]